MSNTKFFAVDRDNVTRSDGTGDGGSHRLYVGNSGSGAGLDYKSLMRFALNWTGVGRIVSATLILYTDDLNGTFGVPASSATPRITIKRITGSWSGGNNGDDSFDSSDYTNPATTTSGLSSTIMSKTVGAANRIDITSLVGGWAPKTVKQSTGAAGLARTNEGLSLEVYGGDGSGHRKYRWEGWSNSHTDPLLRPTIELVYDAGLTKPNVPINMTPSGAVVSIGTFQGDFTDTRPTDTLASSEVEVYQSNGTTRIFQRVQQASNTEITLGRFLLDPTNLLLTPGTTYKWRARYTDNEGQVSDWSALVSFSVTNTNPDPPVISPLAGVVQTMNGVQFYGTFTDPDGDTLLAYQVQLSSFPPNDARWDDGTPLLWDTGKSFSPGALAQDGGSLAWITPYGGQALQAATYYWRARHWDTREGVSNWAYTSIALTQNFNPLPGQQSTVQFDPQVPWRIRIMAMGPNRGPGTILAILDHAKSVGASIVYNSPGELHFTLIKDDPQIDVIEPKQVHYAVDFYSGDGWRETFAGLVWDMDATDQNVVFYGVDYLGLLDKVADERYDPDNINAAPPTGSKYSAKTIAYVVNDQLVRAIGLANSPVGFLTVGTMAAMNEQVTIWSTMSQVLTFVSGLIDSHRQGTGKNTRISVVKTTTGAYQIQVVDDPGQEKPDLAMYYGETVQGYRVIPFGANWASIVHGIGRTREGLRVLYKTQTVPGIDQTVFGRIAQVQVFEGVTDENDLIRRLKQAAIHAGKLGKQLSLGVRTGTLGPLDGYDITDAIPINVVDGAVDTTRYGSGFWIVFAVAWEAGDDGNDNSTLTLLPRDDATPPDSDLIPTLPVSLQQQWQIHTVDPSDASIDGGIWINATTGHIFQWDADNSVWIDLTDTLAGHPRMLGNGIIEDPDYGQPIPGGQNVILNSGFELGAFGTTADALATWDIAGDWTGTVVRAVTNITTGGSLTLTGSTY